jgi:U3 small nucleolar RNA-associated protein 15
MRLVTAGLDGLMRIHSWDSATGQLRFLHGINLNGDMAETGGVAITSMASTFTGDRLAIGTSAGKILVRQMGPSVTPRKRVGNPPAGTYAFFIRGMNAGPVAGDHIANTGVLSGKKRKLATYDLAIRKFRYGDALDDALLTRNAQTVVAVLEELGRRRGLKQALSNRDEESLEPVLAFTARYISQPQFSALLIGVANILIDIYGEIAGQSETIDELFMKLRNQVMAECHCQKSLFRVLGQLDAVITQAEMETRDI